MDQYILVLFIVIGAFYFILLRPVLQQQKRHRSDISSLQIGDEVLTSGGFYAIVREINTHEDRETEIVLEAAPGLLLRGTAAAVGSVTRRSPSAQAGGAAPTIEP
ncbi:MAG: preprotein translocase subunit YajC [Dehalococcoidia bacterium]|nr:MAG: preprotein translocase subunit YajC [Dehalococcoidia bacterium]